MACLGRLADRPPAESKTATTDDCPQQLACASTTRRPWRCAICRRTPGLGRATCQPAGHTMTTSGGPPACMRGLMGLLSWLAMRSILSQLATLSSLWLTGIYIQATSKVPKVAPSMRASTAGIRLGAHGRRPMVLRPATRWHVKCLVIKWLFSFSPPPPARCAVITAGDVCADRVPMS